MKNQQGYEKKVKKRGVKYIAILGISLCFLLMFSGCTKHEEQVEQVKKEVSGQNVDVAIENYIDRPDAIVTDVSKQQERLKTGLIYLSSLGYDTFVADDCDALGQASRSYVPMVQIAIQLSFDVDETQSLWYETDDENIQQFIFLMKKGEPDGIVFGGYYVKERSELNFQYIVDLEDMLFREGMSQNSGPQSHNP